MIKMFEMTLGNMLPDKFYPIKGVITLSNTKDDTVFYYGSCEVPRDNINNTNNYINITGDYRIIEAFGETKQSGNIKSITMECDKMPSALKYQIETVVDDKDFNRMLINGLCRPDGGMSFILGEPITFKVTPVVGYKGCNTQLCDIRVWKEEK